MFVSSSLLLVVPASSPVKTLADLLALGRSNSVGLNYASSGSGTGGYLTGELFEQRTNIKMTHVPYKGTAPALTDVAGGQVQMMFSVIPPALALIKAGRLRAIAVSGTVRLPSLPDVPTVAESRIAALAGGFESTLTYGILAPKHVPEAIVKELSAQILKVAATSEFQARLEVDDAVPMLGDSAAYAAQIKRENAKWSEIVRVSGATAD
jgi:tripartite-type tricarboxylate transporter receptor subunit TctC